MGRMQQRMGWWVQRLHGLFDTQLLQIYAKGRSEASVAKVPYTAVVFDAVFITKSWFEDGRWCSTWCRQDCGETGVIDSVGPQEFYSGLS